MLNPCASLGELSSQMYAQMPLRFHRSQARERFAGTARIEPCQYSSVSFLCRLFPYGLCVMRLPVGEPLSDDALNRPLRTLYVINTESHTVAVTEIELAQISVQMPFAAMLIDALHTAFKDAVVALNRICVSTAAHPFFCLVVDAFVTGKLGSDFDVLGGFVGHQCSLFGDVRANNRNDLSDSSAIHMKAAGRSAALDKGEHGVLVAPAGLGLRLAFKAPDKGFVRLHDRASPAQWTNADDSHGLPQPVRHEPSGFQGDAQGPVKLVARNALLGRAQKVHSLQPKAHWDMARLEYGADLDGKGLAALVAFVRTYAGALALQFSNAIYATAMRANRPFRPYAGFNPRDSGRFILEGFGFKDRFGHGERFPLIKQRYQSSLGTSSIISPPKIDDIVYEEVQRFKSSEKMLLWAIRILAAERDALRARLIEVEGVRLGSESSA